ncbi:MAG: SDR family oxidoreductase [Alphaproteobacteria bacterium]|nr:SDR family oxidoreductase [Alphaproteobacteria bacterium]
MTPPLGLFVGETAVVAGGGGLIGGAIARMLAAEGAQVIVIDKDATRAEAVVAGIVAAGGDAGMQIVDLADRGATDGACRTVLEALGTPHMVVHAANPRQLNDSTLFRVSDDEWDATIAVGLGAGHRLAKIFGSAMARTRIHGRFLYITSLHAATPRNLAHYSATKAGMVMLAKELARGLGPYGIRVNCLAPGWIAPEPADGERAAVIPMRRAGTAEDVAQMAMVLLSDRFSAYVTGTTVNVDGGLSLHSWIGARV